MHNASYHLPDKCCLTCQYSGINTYDDTYCKLYNEVIERGGVCNEYKEEETKEEVKDNTVIEVQSVPETEEQSIEEADTNAENPATKCAHYRTEDSGCRIDGRNCYGICTAFDAGLDMDVYDGDSIFEIEGGEEVIDDVDTPNEDETLTLVHEPLVNTGEKKCENCKQSYLNEEKPWCRTRDIQITGESTCKEWKEDK